MEQRRPAGPRDDQRNAAFQTIFGRPSAQHHQHSVHPHQHPAQYGQHPGQHPHPHPHYYNGNSNPNGYNTQPRQAYYAQYQAQGYPQQQQQQQQQYGQPQYYAPSQYAPSQYSGSVFHQPHHLAAPSMHSRDHSIAGSVAPGIIVPQPQDPPDASLEPYMRSGMTQAQAYQAHLYHQHQHQHPNGHSPQQHPPPPPPPLSAVPPSVSVNGHGHGHGHASRRSESPMLPPVSSDDGRLGIEFGSVLDDGVDEAAGSGSELPWAATHSHSISNESTDAVHVSPPPGWQRDMRRGSTTSTGEPAVRLYLNTGVSHSSTAAPSTADSPASSLFSSRDAALDLLTPATSVPRRSSDSPRTLPYSAATVRRDRPAQDRSQSLSVSSTQARSMMDLARAASTTLAVASRPRSPLSAVSGVSPSTIAYSPSHLGHAPHNSQSQSQTQTQTHRRAAPSQQPLVYPALLSRVAEVFRARITLSERTKDGLAYTDAFDGRDAVDKIAYIIKTTDRNLALLLGRALDAQKFFHDVTYDHRLRDSATELYQFRATLATSPFVSGELAGRGGGGGGGGDAATEMGDHDARSMLLSSAVGQVLTSPPSTIVTDDETLIDSGVELEESAVAGSSSGHDEDASTSAPHSASASPRPPQRKTSTSSDDNELPSGVFTLLTDCYSPTCSHNRLCYSIGCPRRLDQQRRLHMKPQEVLGTVKRQVSQESLHDVLEGGSLWIHTVSEDIANSVSDTEKKRQEAINEVIYTEKHFVRDLEYLRDQWVTPLQKSSIIPVDRRADFIEQVFWNLDDLIAVNTRLRDALSKRQKAFAVVERIGDIFLDAVPHFGPFVKYGAHQLYGKFEFEKERAGNAQFSQFVDETERLPVSRKLELNGYLTKPTTRLARYPLLLEAVLKYTADDNPDKPTLQKVVGLVREFLAKVNVETGKSENRFSLMQLNQQLEFRPEDQINLRLTEESREIIFKGNLSKRSGQSSGADDLQVYLFDHALLMVKQKTKQSSMLRVYRRPIPLELLLIAATSPEDSARRGGKPLLRRNSFNRNSPHAVPVPNPMRTDGKGGYAITFVHLGRKFYQMMLWAPTYITQKKWVEHITKQQDIIRERSLIFDTTTLSEGFFVGTNSVNCATPFNGGRRIAYGTDDGVYFADFNDRREPVKVLALYEVAQLEILEEYRLLIVLSERQVMTFPLDALDPMEPEAGLKRAKKIASHTTFFKSGSISGRTVVCVVKASPLSSTIKVLEPIDSNIRGRNKPTFRKLLQGGNDTLSVYKEFYIPVESTSMHYMKSRLCIGCAKGGFEIVDLETLDAQSLLDMADQSLAFTQKEGLKPISIFRLGDEFLLCYDEFGFYIGRNGWHVRKKFMVHWEGTPTAFAFRYPYVLAFDPTFVEIRNVETGLLSQVIQGNNLRCLFSEPDLLRLGPYAQQQSGYGQAYGNPYHQSVPAFAPEEILIVSDDRVMSLRMVKPPPMPQTQRQSVPSSLHSVYQQPQMHISPSISQHDMGMYMPR